MSKDSFEIGLVMAGAVSAGAYTAGVVDYLVEALMHYQKVRQDFSRKFPGKSLHNVQIRVCAGASAGGMTGSMLLSAMTDASYRPLSGFDPDTLTPQDIANNVFYRSWVDKAGGVDISYLLDTADIKGNKPLKSLLNCTRLTDIADNALCHPRKLQPHDFIPERFDHFVSIFNLGGIPYSMGFQGSGGKYGMVNHADMMHFVLERNPANSPASNEITLSEDPTPALNGNWKLLRESTLATGAFPLALEPRKLSKDPSAYNQWRWWVPASDNTGSCSDNGRCFSLKEIKPDWEVTASEGYEFVSVDGGIANNEPLEIARRALAGADNFNPRDKHAAHRAILMVDPFPSEPFVNDFAMKDLTLVNSATRLFSSLKMQSRFKPGELEAASNPDIFSRFLIAPSRADAPAGQALASSSLGAFGGFLSERFRQHDFQLGRRNCQRFLSRHFVIGDKNPLVREHVAWLREQGCVVSNENGEEMVQIIPMAKLPGEVLNNEIRAIPFADIRMSANDYANLCAQVKKRIATVIDSSAVINQAIDGIAERIKFSPLQWLARKLLGLLSKAIKEFLVAKSTGAIESTMRKDLTARQLL